MTDRRAKDVVVDMLSHAGIQLNGPAPSDIQVLDERLYKRVLREGILGVGEAYMDGWWSCRQLDQLTDKVNRADIRKTLEKNWGLYWTVLRSRIFNLQKIARSFQVGEQHYDAGNDLYQAMLDKRMLYTCAYWKNSDNLDDAQEAKLDLICRKIGLEPGMTVLEYGCGFGAFAKFAAEKYGVRVTGMTVSKEQAKLGREMCKGLPVEILLEDYRKIRGKYDRVISIGIMEHVGYKNYRTYMQRAYENLKEDGIAFIHTIGGNQSTTKANRWTNKYIFPNGMIPSIAQLSKAMEGLFVMEDWHNFGEDYDKTLMAWHANFETAWPQLKGRYSDRFYRMWRFYLLTSAGSFRSRHLQLWQIVMTKPGRNQPVCRLS
jgi:cyclopropane-fatty-acyl-phospholipid synthase